jgi:spoIIIJ-associated protein
MTNESRATLEVIAPSIEEAIEQGLTELCVSREMVSVEVLDEGVKGIFGLGNRQARVRLVLGGEEDGEEETAEEKAAPAAPMSDAELDLENARSIAQAIVFELLDKMGIQRATVDAIIQEETDSRDRPGILVEISGEDLSILIGRRAETLNALQYITRLIVGKEIGHGVNLTVDVEGYRARREQSLRQLARRMAGQAVKTGRRQSLEPMPPNERRIVHLELRDNEEVSTSSVGDEPRRKVTIIPEG